MSSPWVLGHVRFGDVLGAGMLTAVLSLYAFVISAFFTPSLTLWPITTSDILFALVGFVSAIPFRRRGASMISILLGVAIMVAFELVALWLSAAQTIRALGGPDPFALLIPIAAAL